jgi:UDP-galactopyranose mutase
MANFDNRAHERTRNRKEHHNDLLCFSHLRWNFVFQRPQHLMTRFARERRVFYVEEPIFDANVPTIELHEAQGVVVAVPHLPAGLDRLRIALSARHLLSDLFVSHNISDPVFWYYTPMALEFSRDLPNAGIVFDCMDELSAFAGAPPALVALEQELLARAAVVFTGGQSLFEAKREKHCHVHAFPSSVDVAHFARARQPHDEARDHAAIPHPRLGFFGVVDERMDLNLVAGIARQRPDWHQVIIGPCVKIDPITLPQGPNIHYLGMKQYDDLPRYLAGWDVAMLPFARNASTRFISPTKTPEYLAAGRPVVSTSIRDVVRPYGDLGLAYIADTTADFVAAVEAALQRDRTLWLKTVDGFIADLSWERTWGAMRRLMTEAINRVSARQRLGSYSELSPRGTPISEELRARPISSAS